MLLVARTVSKVIVHVSHYNKLAKRCVFVAKKKI